MAYNPKSKDNLKPGNKRGKAKSTYTIANLMDALAKAEKAVTKITGKPFDFLQHCAEEAIKGNDRQLRLAILDRVCPAPKDPLVGINVNGPLILVRHPKALKEEKKKKKS